MGQVPSKRHWRRHPALPCPWPRGAAEAHAEGTRAVTRGGRRATRQRGNAVPGKQGIRKLGWTGTVLEAVGCPKLGSGPAGSLGSS